VSSEPAKTYVEDPDVRRHVVDEVADPGLTGSTSVESEASVASEESENARASEEFDGLRENPESYERREYPEPGGYGDNADSDEFEQSDEFAEADESGDSDESDEPVDVAEFADTDTDTDTDQPSDIVAVEEPDYPSDLTPTTPSTPSATQPDAPEPLLTQAVTEDFRGRWSEVQIGFVEDPQKSVAEADALLAELTRAYQQAVEERRSRISAVRQDGSADTEDLRSALLGYREILTTILPA
jgi:hypothetical protein